MVSARVHLLAVGAVAVLALCAVALLGSVPQVSAATCSGAKCNGTDPIKTGCNQNAYLAKYYWVRDTEKIYLIGDYRAEVYYSRSCGTNWIRVNQNPFGGNAKKTIWANGSRFTEIETDYGYGSSYSMQVYAPGNTPVNVAVHYYDRSGKIRGFVNELLR